MKIQLVPNELSAKIKVLGVGGAGGNAVNDMITSQMVGWISLPPTPMPKPWIRAWPR